MKHVITMAAAALALAGCQKAKQDQNTVSKESAAPQFISCSYRGTTIDEGVGASELPTSNTGTAYFKFSQDRKSIDVWDDESRKFMRACPEGSKCMTGVTNSLVSVSTSSVTETNDGIVTQSRAIHIDRDDGSFNFQNRLEVWLQARRLSSIVMKASGECELTNKPPPERKI